MQTPSAELFDIGVNLTSSQFDKDRTEIVEHAASLGVGSFVITSTSASETKQALKLLEQYPNLYATAGCHPHDAKDFTADDLAFIHDSYLLNQRVVAIGECGLDYNRDFSPRDCQRDVFRQQLKVAQSLNAPVFLHQRDAHQDFLNILTAHISDFSKVVVHCFTGNEAELLSYVELGCYIGITGWVCDERRGHHLLPLLQHIPADRLLIETDAPYLIPRHIQKQTKSRRNQPGYLVDIAQFIAEQTGISFEQLASQTYKNSLRFFQINNKYKLAE
ncbi:type V secretory pathway protein [Catenovulum agarivorans DS-2]|uniref:Type V secretory pathway protein n=1 Tax=Catenovulum agarivorans DS-2 TaxID=1328313 RepID=W7QE46_9ALTE|nr:TatD family hydrolase [Catenovulum agarivorans]EWH11169.1 type V secretory pathway protein [Catenovulum agarivorans DS-2]